jgi:hypothetical protein
MSVGGQAGSSDTAAATSELRMRVGGRPGESVRVDGAAPGGAPGGALQRFARRAAEASAAAIERCDLCGEPVRASHRHLLEVGTRELVCVCQACGLLFTQPAASRGKYRLVPDRHLHLTQFALSDAEWDSLRVPVGICFLIVGAADGQPRAFYPSPMGATEAAVDPATWTALLERYRLLGGIEPDVEALLVNRARGAREHFIVPIDTCFSLVGLVRLRWRGLSGGSDVWTAIGQFFDSLQTRSRAYPKQAGGT